MAISTIEKVTNNSGLEYCQMPDGTLIQYGVMNNLDFNNVSYKSGYRTMPKEFVDMNYIVIAGPIESSVLNYLFRIGCYPNTKGKFAWRMVTGDGAAITATSRSFFWIAIGRWK